MDNVLSFIEWALKRAKKATVPSGAVLAIDASLVGSVTEAEYLWGTSGKQVTQSLLDARFKSYYGKNGWTQSEYEAATKGWANAGKWVCDCQGVLDWYLGSETNANGNYTSYCTDKGLISNIDRPYVIGEALFNGSDTKKTHVGWVCGFLGDEPLVVECRGLSYGLVITRLSKRSWRYRGLMTKKFAYDPVEVAPVPGDVDGDGSITILDAERVMESLAGLAELDEDALKRADLSGDGVIDILDALAIIRSLINGSTYTFTRSLKYGDSGEDVSRLKELMQAKGFGTALTVSNQNFRSSTRAALKMFQTANGLTVDGIAGPLTISALGGKYQ
jgi:hypothetical protein